MRNVFAPTVLLLDETAESGTPTKLWLESRGCRVRQVHCVSDIIESTTDFTLDSRPALILLDCGQTLNVCAEKLRWLLEVTDCGDVPLVALSDSGETFAGDKMVTVKNLEALQPLLISVLTRNYAQAA